MKKICALLIMMLLLVTGCGAELTNLDINKASTAIEKTLKNMEVVEKSTLEDVYGIDFSIIDEYVLKLNTEGDLYAIIKTTNKTETKDDMEAYFEKVKEYNKAYSPERLELLEDRLEKEVGDFLIYIIAEDADSIYQDVINTIE